METKPISQFPTRVRFEIDLLVQSGENVIDFISMFESKITKMASDQMHLIELVQVTVWTRVDTYGIARV